MSSARWNSPSPILLTTSSASTSSTSHSVIPIYQPAADDPLVQAVEKAAATGVIVVASAGNYGTNTETGAVGYAGTTSPGNAPSAITVGAYNHQGTNGRRDDRVTSYSSRGPSWYDAFAKPDVVAPGHLLRREAAPRAVSTRRIPQFRRTGPSGRCSLP